MRGEPVRGALPEPGFFSLPGLERAQALRRGLVPRAPLAHLTGLTITQVRPGTATLTAPASPWLDSSDGLEIHVLAEAALSTAVLAGAPPGADVRTAAISVTQFRPATLDADKFIAHARTIRHAPTFTYAEAAVEDDLGREIARVTGAVLVRPREPPPPAAMPLGPPLDEPAYPTPDPYLRPLPTGVGTLSREQWDQLDGLTLMRSYLVGEARVPVFSLFGMRGIEADRGRLLLALTTSEWLCLRGREIAPGVLATFTHLTLTAASLTLGGPGSRIGVVNMSVRFLRPVVPDGRELVADAQVTDHHGDSMVATVTVTDADGERVASAYQTSILLRVRPRPPTRAEPVLATLLFTDLVGSTARAGQLGDEEWRHLLAEQEALVRHQLEAQRGREIKTTGDGFLATFDSPARAVRCARAIRDGTRRLGLDVRAGIHTGECEIARGDITGIAVHLAARVLNVAAPGEVLVSSTVRDLLLGSGLHFRDRGRHQLKGIEGEWSLFALEE
jgi:class 3 adenylate cyclase